MVSVIVKSLKSVTRSHALIDQALPLHLYALGPPEVRLGEYLVTFPTRKTLALLIYLAIESGPQPRDSIAALLWPEASSERSHGSLRNTLGHLQTALRQAQPGGTQRDHERKPTARSACSPSPSSWRSRSS
jgi:DNA-binding SARP family transcriptional activator